MQHLFADYISAVPPLTSEQWALGPAACAGLGRALPVALAKGVGQARQLVARLPAADAARLRTCALCLARLQRQLELQLAPAVVGKLLALFDA